MEGLSSYNFGLFYRNNKYYGIGGNHQHINYHSKNCRCIKIKYPKNYLRIKL